MKIDTFRVYEFHHISLISSDLFTADPSHPSLLGALFYNLQIRLSCHI